MINLVPERLYQATPDASGEYEKIGELRVTGTGFALFGIPLFVPNISASVDTEIQKHEADAVTNLYVEVIQKSFLILAVWTEYKVTGQMIVFE